MERPETRYVAVGDADVAYQVFGQGPPDLLWCYGLGSHVDLFWERESAVAMWRQMASYSRVIMFDRRGTGASGAIARHVVPTWEEWAEDLGAVLDAAGSEQAVIEATLEAGAIAMLFAALHPERVRKLVLFNTGARFMYDDDYPFGYTPEALDGLLELLGTAWGTDEFAALISPDWAADPVELTILSRQIRASASPRTAVEQYGYILRHLDVREALPLIQAPTLITHVRDSPLVPIEMGRYLAEHIAGSQFIEVPGSHLGIPPPFVQEQIAEFVTGERPDINVDRVLTTIMFTDIVGSTEQAAALGDQRWRSLLDAHDKTVREQFRQFRGREVNTTGDGFVASFDGPARAIRCAEAITEATAKMGVELRVGLHTGECEVRGEDLGGLAVHIAARVATLAAPGGVLVSETVKGLIVGSGIPLCERGTHTLKGVPDEWKLFAVQS